jgi:energy-coupling factor transport system permease protein
MSLIPVYRDRPSALHASRAGAGAAFCGALALTGALYLHPLILSAALAAIVLAGVVAGVGREIGRSLRFALPFALLITLINPLVYPEGDTLLVRGGEVLGRQIDITLEATAAGVLNGLRVIVIVTAFGLMSAAVDPDQLLRMFRRISYRSALTATLATRLVPVLARDATRMSDAARCRPRPPGRLALARAALAGSLDRAVDVAAALEVRGYALGGRTARRARPWSRHDWRVAGAAFVIAVVSVAGAIAGVGSVEPYPSLQVETGGIEVMLSAFVLVSALAPFAGRAARMGVAHAS